jgi:hypothetical protein
MFLKYTDCKNRALTLPAQKDKTNQTRAKAQRRQERNLLGLELECGFESLKAGVIGVAAEANEHLSF